MKTHELKTWPEYYQAIIEGRKPFDIRKNDRGFEVGDRLLLREWDPHCNNYTGRQQLVEVQYMIVGSHDTELFGLRDGFVAMAIANLDGVYSQ